MGSIPLNYVYIEVYCNYFEWCVDSICGTEGHRFESCRVYHFSLFLHTFHMSSFDILHVCLIQNMQKLHKTKEKSFSFGNRHTFHMSLFDILHVCLIQNMQKLHKTKKNFSAYHVSF
jgi:hypothetical protein